jgi:uncharacterized protein DUF1844
MAQENSSDKPKIHIDDDWKQQAQAEKEKLAEQVEKPTQGDDAAADESAQGPREIPPASFTTLISSLITQTMMAMGGYQDPKTGKRIVDLDVAKHHIDTMKVLEEKTKGNLSDEEAKLLDQALYESRMQYVQIAQQMST